MHGFRPIRDRPRGNERRQEPFQTFAEPLLRLGVRVAGTLTQELYLPPRQITRLRNATSAQLTVRERALRLSGHLRESFASPRFISTSERVVHGGLPALQRHVHGCGGLTALGRSLSALKMRAHNLSPSKETQP